MRIPSLQSSRRGISILEVLLVCVIIVMVSALAVPTLDALFGDTKLKGSSDKIRNVLNQARSKAIEDGIPYRFAIVADTPKFKVAPDRTTIWGDVGSVGEAEEGVTDLIIEDEISKDINFGKLTDNSETSGEFTLIITFNPDGSASVDREIVIETSDSAPVVIKVRAMTGAVTVFTRNKQ